MLDFLLNVAVVRPPFIWGPPGIGKTSVVERFANAVGLPCVSLLGSQLAPEDLIGVPQIVGNYSQFCPPKVIARDELNASTPEVMKAFYSLIHEQRIGEYHLPKGSVVIAAGNREEDSALARPLPSARINRMVQESFSTPRSWYMLSDAMKQFGETISPEQIKPLAYGTLTQSHATNFSAFVKQIRSTLRCRLCRTGDDCRAATGSS